MIDIITKWITEVNWFILVLPPFFIWYLSGAFLVGFVPEIKKRKSVSGEEWKEILNTGLVKALKYKWELFFTSVHLWILSMLFLMLGVIINELSIGFSESLFDVLMLIPLLIILFGKCKNINESISSASFVGGFKYIYGGFSNPFRE